VKQVAKVVSIIGLNKISIVKPGDDVAQLIFEKAKEEDITLADGDLVVISQKIVSKAKGLLVDTSESKPGQKAKALAKRTKKDPRVIELILQDSADVLRADTQAFVVRRKDGLVCLNAGVDKSNVEGRFIYSRLPPNSDVAADEILSRLERLSGKRLAVIIADTYSRPLRVGQVEFAIGVAGVEPIVDYRGLDDMFGYSLRYKYVALADEAAAAAELVMGQGTERTPVAIIRGLDRMKRSSDRNLSRKLLLGRRLDLFR
jgi:coenzyme F420-0:L-glutamate ligase/coenzyme F420-1:gamma-L-glutamate ligase